jgi:hypothetical protein
MRRLERGARAGDPCELALAVVALLRHFVLLGQATSSPHLSSVTAEASWSASSGDRRHRTLRICPVLKRAGRAGSCCGAASHAARPVPLRGSVVLISAVLCVEKHATRWSWGTAAPGDSFDGSVA